MITNKIILSFFSVPVHNPEYVLAYVIRDVGAALMIYCVAIAKQVSHDQELNLWRSLKTKIPHRINDEGYDE